MTDLIIVAGIPGCGKSTWAAQFRYKYKIVSADAIRKDLFKSLVAAHIVEDKQANNKKVFEIFHREIEDTLRMSVDVIADATSLNDKARAKLREVARKTNTDVHLVLFRNTDAAHWRNQEREEDAQVPPDVMTFMLSKYFDTLAALDGPERESYKSVTEIVKFDTA